MQATKLGTLLIVLVACYIGAFSGNLFFQLLLITSLGVFLHYLNGLQKSSITAEPLDYFLGAFAHTLASIGGCVLAVFGILQSGHAETLDFMLAGSAFAAGYTSDSILNKPP